MVPLVLEAKGCHTEAINVEVEMVKQLSTWELALDQLAQHQTLMWHLPSQAFTGEGCPSK